MFLSNFVLSFNVLIVLLVYFFLVMLIVVVKIEYVDIVILFFKDGLNLGKFF